MRNYIYIMLLINLITFSSCEDLLERPTLTQTVDDNFWRSETDIRLYTNSFYELYFIGYNVGWGTDFAPVRSTTFSDDFVSEGSQSRFENNVPTSHGSRSETRSCRTEYYGPTWGFGRVRKINIYLDRVENVAKTNISEEAYKHWLAVGKFFKAYEYADLVNVYGDVPYYEDIVSDVDLDMMYKNRDPRGEVMDKVYDLLVYALENLRADDGAQTLNKYIAAGFISRFMLNEGTWQKYHNLDQARAKRYLELAVRAGDMVIEANKWTCSKDYKSIFTSLDLKGHPEVLLHRTYDSGLGIMHHIASYTGGRESQTGVNLEYIKSFLCQDGKPYSISSVAGANDFSIQNLTLTRDPRFEANFINRPHNQSSSLLYSYKYASRQALDHYFSTGGTLLTEWSSQFNISDAPIMYLGEILLNWIEAKAELAISFGGVAITQNDLNKSINSLRDRPLDAVASGKGLIKTSALQLNDIPNDPSRDSDVPSLLWEIRRERRMELFYEGNRIKDLRRWKKLHYMDYGTDRDKLLGPWINFPVEYPVFMNEMKGVLKVQKLDGSIVTYNSSGSNASDMVGFYVVRNATNRDAFSDRNYLAPIGQQQIDDYAERGYTLTQTNLW